METVICVKPSEDYTMELKFSTGEARIFDARPYLEKRAFIHLKDLGRFKQAYVAFDTVCWPGNPDIAPDTLYDCSRPVS